MDAIPIIARRGADGNGASGGAGEHGPNEHLLIEEAAGAMATVARLLGAAEG